MLQIKNLTKHFGGVNAVNSCSFGIEENSITAIIGPNGSGKSTIFNLISGILRPDAGAIIYNKKDISFLCPEDISNVGISRLFQNSQLFDNLTIRENLLLAINNEDTKFWKNVFGKNKITKEKEDLISDMLELIEMKHLSHKLGRELSFGQKRLVEIVRTILNPHNLLILDEPVAGVNPKLKKKISEILLGLKSKGETVLVVEHDMNFILKLADRVIVLDEGVVIAEGTPDEIRNNKKVLEAYLGN